MTEISPFRSANRPLHLGRTSGASHGRFADLHVRVRDWSVYARTASFRTIIVNTASLGGTTLVTAALGYLFWILAARQLPAAAVGFAGASISAMTLLGTAGVLGFGTLLISELPKAVGGERPLLLFGVSVAGLAGTLFGMMFAVLAPSVAPDLAPLGEDTGRVMLFGIGVGLTSATIVLDQALISLSRGTLQLLRNTVFAAAKLGLLLVGSVWAGGSDGMTIYTAWVGGNVLSLAGLIAIFSWTRRSPATPRPATAIASVPLVARLRALGRAALSHHALNLALQAPYLILPLIATAFLSVTVNAYFYIAWVLAGFVFIGPGHLATALYATAARTPSGLASKVRFTLGLGTAVSFAAIFAVLIGASFVLGMFGDAYADQAAWSLRVLVFWALPLIVKDHYVVLRRLQGRTGSAAVVVAASGVLEIVLASVGAQMGGLYGLSIGWLLAGWLQVVVMVPTVYHAAMGPARGFQRDQDVPTLGLRGEATI